MKELKLIDRVVVEIKSEVSEYACNDYVAARLREIADEIERCMSAGDYEPNESVEVLWEHETPRYSGFKILSDKSLISQYYYGSEPKPRIIEDGYFPITTVSREDLNWKGFDTSNVDDDTMEQLASKMGNAYCDNGYWEDLEIIADYLEIPRKRGSIRDHLDDVLVDDETETGGVSHHGETLREFLEEIPTALNKTNITLDDDVSVLDDILKECGILPIE